MLCITNTTLILLLNYIPLVSRLLLELNSSLESQHHCETVCKKICKWGCSAAYNFPSWWWRLVITLNWAGGFILQLDIMVSFSHELDLLCGKIEQEIRKLFQIIGTNLLLNIFYSWDLSLRPLHSTLTAQFSNNQFQLLRDRVSVPQEGQLTNGQDFLHHYVCPQHSLGNRPEVISTNISYRQLERPKGQTWSQLWWSLDSHTVLFYLLLTSSTHPVRTPINFALLFLSCKDNFS